MKSLMTLVFGFAALALVATPVFADTLTFPNSTCSASADGSGGFTVCGDGSFINQAYGDTANVQVTYKDLFSVGQSLHWWDGGYNDLQGVLWGDGGDTPASHARIELDPLLGQMVTLNSLDMGAYFLTTRDTTLQILDLVSGTVLYSFTGPVGTGSGHTSFSPNVSSLDGLAIEWQNSAYNDGVDNINFTIGSSTRVPEPNTLSLIGVSLALFAGCAGIRRLAAR